MKGVLDFWAWLIGGMLMVAIALIGPAAFLWWLTGDEWVAVVAFGVEIVALLSAAAWSS